MTRDMYSTTSRIHQLSGPGRRYSQRVEPINRKYALFLREHLENMHREVLEQLSTHHLLSSWMSEGFGWQPRLFQSVHGVRFPREIVCCADFFRALDSAYGHDGDVSEDAIIELLYSWEHWLECPSWLSESDKRVARVSWISEYDVLIRQHDARNRPFIGMRFERIRSTAILYTKCQGPRWRGDTPSGPGLRPQAYTAPEDSTEADTGHMECSSNNERTEATVPNPPKCHATANQHKFLIVDDEFMGNRNDHWRNHRNS